MAIEITWDDKPRPWGFLECRFDYCGESILMQANDALLKSWDGDTKARDAWAQDEAAKIVARRDYEASDECKLEQLTAEKERLVDELAVKTVEAATLDAKVNK